VPTDPLAAVRYPDLTYAPNIPADLQKLIQDLVVNGVPKSATTSARDTAYTAYVAAGGTLADGRTCETDDAGYWTRLNGAWVGMYGIRAVGVSTTTQTANPGPTRLVNGLLINAYLKPGHAYTVKIGLRVWSTVSGDAASAVARLTLGGGTAVPGDPGVTWATADITSSGSANLYNLMGTGKPFQVTTAGTYTVSIWLSRTNGTGTLTGTFTGSGEMTCELYDVGVATTNMTVI
jgi:hypothetical protein